MIAYEHDVLAWSIEQARLLREGRFDRLDIEHLADEIEDVGKSEKRELRNRLAVLLAHLLKWQFQPARRGSSWRGTIREQRSEIADDLKDSPSLKTLLDDPAWLARVWSIATAKATSETGLEDFPADCPWTAAQALDAGFWPD